MRSMQYNNSKGSNCAFVLERVKMVFPVRILLLVCLFLVPASCRHPKVSGVVRELSQAASLATADSFAPGDSVPVTVTSTFDTSSFFTSVPIDSVVFARMSGRSYKDGCPVAVEDLRYLRLLHRDLSGRTLVGEMVANKSIADDLLEIFHALYDAGYPIERMRLIDDYDGDDEASMLDNNTSCFNYRRKAHMSSVSKHAYGEAVDINPLYNPYYRVTPAGARIVEPAAAASYVDRTGDFPYKIERGDLCHRLFLEHGFHWGGSWTRSKDYQHFAR